MGIWFTLGIFLISGSGALAAGECSTVDNSADFGAVRDQGQSGWCYAFAAADLLGERLGIKPPDMISAFDLAMGYYTMDSRKAAVAIETLDLSHYTSYIGSPEEIRGALRAMARRLEEDNQNKFMGKPLYARSRGNMQEAISLYSLKGGYCLESQLPSQDIRYESQESPKAPFLGNTASGNPFEDLPDSRDFIFRQILRLENEGGSAPAGGSFPCGAGMGSAGPAGPSLEAYGLPMMMSALSEPILQLAQNKVSGMVEHLCRPRKPYPPFVSLGSWVSDPASLEGAMGNLNSHLREHQSVGISFNGCDITKDHKSLDPEGSGCGHASIVMGRKRDPDTGECLYQIRNSWGRDCSVYAEDIRARCERGIFWMSEKRLRASLHGVDWID